MKETLKPNPLNELIQNLDEAIYTKEICCYRVKQVLERSVENNQNFLPSYFLQPTKTDSYARRLIHQDPENNYTLLAMVWNIGQGAPLHDHANQWCVECVYRGVIRVTSFKLLTKEDECYQFEQDESFLAEVGSAKALIPPYEYHTIENAGQDIAVTLHVYSGVMNWCHVFYPTPNGFRKERRILTYTN